MRGMNTVHEDYFFVVGQGFLEVFVKSDERLLPRFVSFGWHRCRLMIAKSATSQPLCHATAAVGNAKLSPHIIADVFHVNVNLFVQMRQKFGCLFAVQPGFGAAILGL